MLKKSDKRISAPITIAKALAILFSLSVVIIAISSFFIMKSMIMWPVFLLMGFFNLLIIKSFKIKTKWILPDLGFGFMDNGVMVFAAILGGSFGGVPGAIIGGVTGNAITDGLGGFFEGYISEKQEQLTKFKTERKAFSSALGKMTGCLFGAATSLFIIWAIRAIFNI